MEIDPDKEQLSRERRKFKEALFQMLDILREDIEEGDISFEEEFKFDEDIDLDPELTFDLRSYFDRSGLNFTSPGHWKVLLTQVVDVIYTHNPIVEGRPGRPSYTRDENDQFIREIVALKKAGPEIGRLSLCKLWLAKNKKAGNNESLRVRLHNLEGNLRAIADAGRASDEELEWLAVLRRPPKRV